MIDYELLKPEDYDGLPDEPEKQFLEIERLARRRMYDILQGPDDNQFQHDVRVHYMVTVSAAGEELGIEGVDYPTNGNDFADNYDTFQHKVQGTITRLLLRNAKLTSVHSVKLANRSRGRIELEIAESVSAELWPSSPMFLDQRALGLEQ